MNINTEYLNNKTYILQIKYLNELSQKINIYIKNYNIGSSIQFEYTNNIYKLSTTLIQNEYIIINLKLLYENNLDTLFNDFNNLSL
jgi:hypothetical protein